MGFASDAPRALRKAASLQLTFSRLPPDWLELMARNLRDLLACASLRILLGIVSCLPLSVALSLARFLGRLLFRVSARRRRIALRNLEIAFGSTLPLESRRRIAVASFEHLMASLAWFAVRDRKVLDSGSRFEISGAEDDLLRAAHPGGLVFLSGHVGDWEMVHHYLALRGIKVAVITRAVANGFIDREIERRRTRLGARTIPKQGGLAALRTAVKQGVAVGLLADQNCPARERFFDFLGTPASTYTEFARVLARTKATILFVTCVRKARDSRFEVIVRDIGKGLPELPGSPSVDRAQARADELVRRYLLEVEDLVRSHPEQYLWIHRRWKSRPTGAPWLYGDLKKPLDPLLLAWRPDPFPTGKRMEPR